MTNILGFTHEHNRNDRDQHIFVDFNRIQQYEQNMFLPNGTWQKEFIKCNATRIGKKWGCRTMTSYDHESITHYPGTIGEINPQTVITPKVSCGNESCKLGQREKLSSLDIKGIEILYQCGMKVPLLL